MWERLVLAVVMLAGCREVFGLEPPHRIGGDDDVDAPAADAPASCTDQQLSPGETDVDCGGVCPPCAVGDTCVGHLDCVTGVCKTTTCVQLGSCKEIFDAGQKASGIYAIAPGSATPFDAYCDQTSDGGGWTLLLKLSSAGTAFAYDSQLWTTTAILNETDLGPNLAPQGVEAKLRAFNVVTGTELRLQWLDPVHAFHYAIGQPRTALQVFMGGEDKVLGDESNACHGSLLDASPDWLGTKMRHAAGPQFYGVNGQDNTPNGNARLRFGFASNDEIDNEWNPHQGAGTDAESLKWDGQTDCNNCSCYGTEYAPTVTSANLWIR